MLTVKPNLKGAILYEVKNFRYVVGGRRFAEIEILVFAENSHGAQAKIEEGPEIAIDYPRMSFDDALEAIIQKIEEKIKDDPYVVKCQKKL